MTLCQLGSHLGFIPKGKDGESGRERGEMVTGVNGEKRGGRRGEKQKEQEKWMEETGAEGATRRKKLFEKERSEGGWLMGGGRLVGGRVNGRRGNKKG